MSLSSDASDRPFNRRLLIWAFAGIMLGLVAVTWISMEKGRSDSFSLLVGQGRTFTEALAEASGNAIMAEGRYQKMLRLLYRDIAESLASSVSGDGLSPGVLLSFVRQHGIRTVYLFDDSGNYIGGSDLFGEQIQPPEFIISEVIALIEEPEKNEILLTDTDDETSRQINFYLKLTNTLDKVIVIEAEETLSGEASERTGIGFLVQRLAREPGIEYILYQTPDGIVFSSRRTGSLLAIESDPFLRAALKGDTIVHRRYMFHEREVLEMARPFATVEYPLGLFRVGLSLDQYELVSSGIHQRMLILLLSLLALALVILLWIRSMRKGKEIGRRYEQMKSYTGRIYEQMQSGVAVIDREGRIKVVNAAFDRILGLTTSSSGSLWAESVGRRYPSLMEIASEESNELDRDEIERSIKVGDEIKNLLIVRSTLIDAPDKTRSTILVISDISRLKEFERITSRRERLSEMGELAAGVAHEIRNPLNSISIAAQRLSQEFRTSENKEEFESMTSRIRTETNRLNGIITRFLALARVRESELHVVDVSTYLSQVRDLLSDEAERCGIELDVSTVDSPHVRWDSDKMKQVFLNLFANTREALGGSAGRFIVEAVETNDVVHIRVEDTGPGIPPENRHKVFTPYFTTKDSGTGLGLSVVYNIVTEMSGDVEVICGRSAGATIMMTFPASKNAE